MPHGEWLHVSVQHHHIWGMLSTALLLGSFVPFPPGAFPLDLLTSRAVRPKGTVGLARRAKNNEVLSRAVPAVASGLCPHRPPGSMITSIPGGIGGAAAAAAVIVMT